MKRMNKPGRLLIAVTCALLLSLGLANACLADFSDPIQGNNNVYMLSAESGAWEMSGSGRLNFRELGVQTYRYAEWPGAASGVESISLSEFLSLWEKGGVFQGLELIGTLSIAGRNGQADYNVLIKDVRRNTEASTVELVVDFGNAQGPDNSGDASLVIKDWHGPATETVRLNLVYGDYPPNPRIAIFQENLAGPAGGGIIVWKTIATCKECNHPFVINPELYLSAMDSHGNSTTRMQAEPGRLFRFYTDYSGPCLHIEGAASDPSLLQVAKDPGQEDITIRLGRNGRRLASSVLPLPGRLVSFSFDQVLYVGIASNLEEGDRVSPDQISYLRKVPLAGIAQADIKVTGNKHEGYKIYLENIQWR